MVGGCSGSRPLCRTKARCLCMCLAGYTFKQNSDKTSTVIISKVINFYDRHGRADIVDSIIWAAGLFMASPRHGKVAVCTKDVYRINDGVHIGGWVLVCRMLRKFIHNWFIDWDSSLPLGRQSEISGRILSLGLGYMVLFAAVNAQAWFLPPNAWMTSKQMWSCFSDQW